MSSLRNSLYRRNHKERSQLAHRTRLGALEKHKDYVLRARDYHSKQDRLQRLRQKAADRNKDEFYFGMHNERTKQGVHVQERGNTALPVDVVKVLKTQDENYIKTMRSSGQKKIDRLKNRLSLLSDLVRPHGPDMKDDGDLTQEEMSTLKEAGIISGGESSSRRRSNAGTNVKGRHIVFAEDDATARHLAKMSKTQPKSSKLDETPEDPVDLGWKVAESSVKRGKRKAEVLLDEMEVDTAETGIARESREHRAQLVQELAARLVRDKQLSYAGRELEMQRLMMGKGGRRKVRGIEKVDEQDEQDREDDDDFNEARKAKKVDEKTWRPRVYKWRMERKR